MKTPGDNHTGIHHVLRLIRKTREQRNITQAQAAAYLRTHRPSYTLIETGQQHLTAEQLLLLLELLEIDVADLLDATAKGVRRANSTKPRK